MHAEFEAAHSCEVLVAGAGLAGLVAAIGFAQAGFDVVLCGRPERLAYGRTVALLESSVRCLRSLNLWEAVERRAAPLRALRLIDDTGSLWSAAPVEFRAGEIGLEAFGWNIENVEFLDVLFEAALAQPGLRVIDRRIAAYRFQPHRAQARCEGGEAIAAALVVGADGRASPARKAAGIDASVRAYPQTAMTTIVSHTRPHQDCSTEFHKRSGPFTLVPLPNSPAGAWRSSLVWVMSNVESRRRAGLDDGALADEIEGQSQSILGKIGVEGRRGLFPLALQSARPIVATRLALVGDAAHVLPPIGAQGLNLGLRDAAHLIEATSEAKRAGRDIGGPATLAHYAGLRRLDALLRSQAVDGLNRSLLAAFAPLDLLRGLGLSALSAIGPLRRFVMREGALPHFSTPRVVREARAGE